MLSKERSLKSVILPVILIVLIASGCSSQTSTVSGSGVGYVTETTMTDTVESSGSVSAKQLATLSWGTSGNILEINVETNQQVASGDVLMKLDSQTAPTEVIEAISTLVTAEQNLAIAKESKTDLAEAEVALNTAQQAYYEALGYSYTLDKPVGSEDYNAILRANVVKAQETVDSAEEVYEGYDSLQDTDTRKVNARAALAEARIALEQAESIYAYYTNTPNAMDAAEITANLNLATAQLEDAQRTYDQIKNGDNTDAITTAQAAVDSAQATVNKLSIIAPFDGEVAVIYSQIGDVVSSGTQALVLVDRTKMYVDVSVDETSISRVQVGDAAEITFDALGITTTGKVTLIDPIGTSSSGVVNYTVRVELDKTDPAILIGATASVVITTGDPQSVLFVPVSAVLSDAQGEYVMRVNNDGSTERVTVVSGEIYDDTVVVVGDLQNGQAVQLYTTTSDSADEEQSGNILKGGDVMPGGEIPSGGGEMPSGGGQPPSGGGQVP